MTGIGREFPIIEIAFVVVDDVVVVLCSLFRCTILFKITMAACTGLRHPGAGVITISRWNPASVIVIT